MDISSSELPETVGSGLKLLLPPKRIPSDKYSVWLTGLAASETLITCGIVLEYSKVDNTEERQLAKLVPLKFDVWLAMPGTSGSERLKAIRWGGESGSRGVHMTFRAQPWDPSEFAEEAVLQIVHNGLGINFESRFRVH